MSQQQSSELVMLSRILLVGVAVIGLAAASQGADAAQSKRAVFSKSQKPTNANRIHPSGPHSLRIGTRSGAGKCGTWVCTWPISGGGCLVWEKTLCKIKTIDPFN
jgi:hypothetical protein